MAEAINPCACALEGRTLITRNRQDFLANMPSIVVTYSI